MTETSTIDFTGRFRVTNGSVSKGTLVTISRSNGDLRADSWSIAIGDAAEPLAGSFDPANRTLKALSGRYDFVFSLSGRKPSRRLLCAKSLRDGTTQTSTWEADEDGP